MVSLQNVHYNAKNLNLSIKTHLKLIPSIKNIKNGKNWRILGFVYDPAPTKGEIFLIK